MHVHTAVYRYICDCPADQHVQMELVVRQLQSSVCRKDQRQQHGSAMGDCSSKTPPTHEKARWARVHVHLCRIASPAYLHWKKSFHRLLARHWNIELFDVRPQRRQQLKYASAHDDGVESNALRKAKSLIQFLHLIVFSFVRLFRLVENNSSRTLKDGIDLAL